MYLWNQIKKRILIGGLGLLLSACEDWLSLPSASEGQVLVRVNDSEITILQYKNILHTLGILTPSESVKLDIINKLIDRELAVQQAYKQGLDRQPEIILQLEEAKHLPRCRCAPFLT